MRSLGMSNLGGVFNMEYATPVNETDARSAAALYDGYYNRFFLSGVFRGEYPENVMEGLGPHLPEGWQDDFGTIGAPLDWCGINYYTRKVIAPKAGPWPAHEEVDGPLPKTQMGWEICPEGLGFFLRRTKEEYTGDLPIYITENGMASDDRLEAGAVSDAARLAYLEAHLAEIRGAIDAGVPTVGYFVWSLLDNYEWAYGYEKRFGLVHVDFDTLKRTPKASYHALSAGLAR